MKSKMLSGIQPTNKLHIGNFFTIKEFVKYQDKYDLYVFVADLHALSAVKPDYENLYKNKIDLVATYVAAGLDLEKTKIFFQSDVAAHSELY
jgi:tryptophanyl-tRNA synthetase